MVSNFHLSSFCFRSLFLLTSSVISLINKRDLLYLSYKFLFKNKFDSFTIFSSLMTGSKSVNSFLLFDW